MVHAGNIRAWYTKGGRKYTNKDLVSIEEAYRYLDEARKLIIDKHGDDRDIEYCVEVFNGKEWVTWTPV